MNEQQSETMNDQIHRELERIVAEIFRISADVGDEIQQILNLEREQPMSDQELERMLSKVLEVLRKAAEDRTDTQALASLQGDITHIVSRLTQQRNSVSVPLSQGTPRIPKQLLVPNYNGIQPQPVWPRPWFHGKEVPMMGGFIRTKDIHLWDANERLEIHLNQFREKYGRGPHPDELLEIMLSRLPLEGLTKDDAFEIEELARSIAINGVRKPPIVDVDGTLLDGNRRITACYYLLNSPEFDMEQKKRAEYVFAWQLTEHATDDDRQRVVVSLNFENDCKQEWPQYVKARKVFEEWQSMLALEYPAPGPKRQAAMKRELSQRFALGPNTDEVNRFLRMVEAANEFEDYQIEALHRDLHQVQHKANEKFQYFDELSKGVSPGKVAYELNQNEPLKHLVFDLLFQGKFSNFTQIRHLKKFPKNDEARELLRKAHEYEVKTKQDLEHAQELVEEAIAVTKLQDADERSLGVNTRIENFVKWLEELPVKAFRDEVKPENADRLLAALDLVTKYIAERKEKEAQA